MVLYLIITTFVVQTFRVEQESMIDTLQPQQHLLIDKLTPRFDDYSRGDIIVFHPEGDTDKTPFIKRVIGVGGERVEIRERLLSGSMGRASRRTTPTSSRTPCPRGGEISWDVPEGSLFVMGDHRQGSKDSRSAYLGVVADRPRRRTSLACASSRSTRWGSCQPLNTPGSTSPVARLSRADGPEASQRPTSLGAGVIRRLVGISASSVPGR